MTTHERGCCFLALQFPTNARFWKDLAEYELRQGAKQRAVFNLNFSWPLTESSPLSQSFIFQGLLTTGFLSDAMYVGGAL